MNYDIPAQITGDTWEGIPIITFTKNGSALDLTGASVEMAVKLVYNLATPNVFPLSTATSGIVILNPPTAGNISILPRIADIPVGNYAWSLTLSLCSGEVNTYLMGNWPIIPRSPFSTDWQNTFRTIQ